MFFIFKYSPLLLINHQIPETKGKLKLDFVVLIATVLLAAELQSTALRSTFPRGQLLQQLSLCASVCCSSQELLLAGSGTATSGTADNCEKS